MLFKPIYTLDMVNKSAYLSNKDVTLKGIRLRFNILKYKFKIKWPIRISSIKSISVEELSEFCSIFKSLEDIMHISEFEGKNEDIYFKVNITNNLIDRSLISSIALTCMKDNVIIMTLGLQNSLESGMDIVLEIRDNDKNYKIQRYHSTDFISEYDTNETSRNCFLLIRSIIFYWYELLFIKIKEKYLYEK